MSIPTRGDEKTRAPGLQLTLFCMCTVLLVRKSAALESWNLFPHMKGSSHGQDPAVFQARSTVVSQARNRPDCAYWPLVFQLPWTEHATERAFSQRLLLWRALWRALNTLVPAPSLLARWTRSRVFQGAFDSIQLWFSQSSLLIQSGSSRIESRMWILGVSTKNSRLLEKSQCSHCTLVTVRTSVSCLPNEVSDFTILGYNALG